MYVEIHVEFNVELGGVALAQALPLEIHRQGPLTFSQLGMGSHKGSHN